MGRRTKLTEEVTTQLETTLRSHTSIKTTCDLVGIGESTFHQWVTESEALAAKGKTGLKAEFAERIKRARAMSRVMLVNQIQSDPSWQAKAWILERQYPEEFGRRQLIAHAGADGKSDLAPSAGAVNLTIKMQGAESDAGPWVHKAEQDAEPDNGADPWDTDSTTWPQDAPAQPADPTAAKPALKASVLIEAMTGRIAIDTGGRPRDPDEQ